MKQHILVIDDEAPVRDLLAAFFKRRGYQVSVTTNVAESLKQLQDGQVHLVILDLALGNEDGMQLLTSIKALDPALPVIILTGMGFDEELLQEARDRGAVGYLSKTLPLDQLLMEVHRALDYKR